MKYSSTTKGFYSEEIQYDNMPKDAVDVPMCDYKKLIRAQCLGKVIQPDENGYPVAVTPVPTALTESELSAQRAEELRQQLTANDLASVRPLRAKVAGTATAEDEARLVELEEQAQALRAELAEVSA
jgi:hypothetical protein